MDNNFDKIEAFLFGMLTDSEKVAFEKDLSQNTALQAALAQHQQEHRAMELALRDDLRKNLQVWKTEKAEETSGSTTQSTTVQVSFVRRNLFQIAAAASVALVIGYFSRTLFQSNNISTDEYYNESSYAARSFDDPSIPPVLRPGLQSMGAGNYADAIAQFGAVQDPAFVYKAKLFAAECHYKMANYSAAIAQLTEVLQVTGNKSERETAEWHLVLNHLKAGDKQLADPILNKIAADAGHEFQLEARKVLDK